MDEALKFLVFAFTSIFTIVNPFSAATMFVTITENDSQEKRKAMALRASIVCALVMIVFAFIGTYILSFFSITIDAFRLAGGLLIAKVGWDMLKNKERYLKSKEEKEEAIKKDDISIVPLAIPMLSGAGAITTSIVLMQQATGALEISFIVASILVTSLITFIILSKSHLMVSKIGNNGKSVIEKLIGLLVMVVGVQYLINGIHGILVVWGLLV